MFYHRHTWRENLLSDREETPVDKFFNYLGYKGDANIPNFRIKIQIYNVQLCICLIAFTV